MFFPRLRRRAKWVFLLLAICFALAFVVAGVGTGLGSGLGDYLSDLFNRQPGAAGPSAESARERLEKNPSDADAHLELANALQADGKTDEAITALERYTALKSNDSDALQQLAGLYLVKAGEAEARAQAARIEAARAYFSNELQPPNSKIAKSLGRDPITEFVRQETTQEYTAALTAAQEAYRKEAAVWQRLTKLEPDEAGFYLELGRSSAQARDTKAAIAAYERYLELAPDSADAPQIRQLIKELRKQEAAGGLPIVGG